MEAHQLRVEDLVFARGEIIVRDAKGGKDRVTVLPASIVAPLREHLAKHFARFKRQRRRAGRLVADGVCPQVSGWLDSMGLAVGLSGELAVQGCLHRATYAPSSA
jgi:integrase